MMDADAILFSLLTPKRRFPTKAVALATEDRALGVNVATRALRAMLDEVRAGAFPRTSEEVSFFDPAVSYGAIHASFLLGWHRATEAEAILEEVLGLSDAQMDALYGDLTHEVLPQAVDGVARAATLERWSTLPLAPDAQAAVHDALIRRVARGALPREAVRATLASAIERWRGAPDTKVSRNGVMLCALGFWSVALASELAPLRSILGDDTKIDGALTPRDLEGRPESEEAWRQWAARDHQLTTLRDPRAVEALPVFGWEPPEKPSKKKPRKKAKRKKPRGKKR